MKNKQLNWHPMDDCNQCRAFEEEREFETIDAQYRTNATNRQNHLAKRYAKFNKRKNQHLSLFHADFEALEKEVVKFQ